MSNLIKHLGYFSPRELGEAFRAERLALNKSQQWVADQCKFRRQTIIDLEKGENVTIFTLMAALTALGKGLLITDRRVSLDQLAECLREMDEDDEPKVRRRVKRTRKEK